MVALTRLCRSGQVIFWAIIATAVVLVTFDAMLDLAERLVPKPTYYQRINSVALNKKVYAPGEELVTTSSVDRFMPESCSIVVDRFILEQASREVVWSQIVPGILTNGHNQKIVRRVTVPKLVDGCYLFRAAIHNQCVTFSQTVTADAVPFCVKAEE